MHRLSIANRLALLLSLCLILLLAPTLAAAPLDNRIPADALIYIGWQGADALAPQYQTSNLKGIIDSSTLPAFITQKITELKGQALGENPSAAGDIDATTKSLDILWRHPAAFYFGRMNFPAGERQIPKFRIALLSDAGPDAKALTDLLQGELKAHPIPPDAPKLAVEQDGDVVIITFDQASPADFKLNGEKLSGLPAYISGMSHVDKDGAVTMYIDGKGSIDTIKDAFSTINDIPPEIRNRVPAIIEALGLNGIREATYSGKFDNKAWRELAFIGVEGPHKGLVELADTANVSDAVLALVPQNAAAMTAGRLDLTKVLALVREVASKVSPAGVKTINDGLAMGSAQMGFDIEKDLINTFGDEWAFYRAPNDSPTLSFTLVQQPKDAGTLTTTIATLENLINTKSNGRVAVEKIDGPNGSQISAIRTPQFSVAWAIHNGTFYISNVDGALPAVQQVENKAPSILTNPSYIAALSALPVQKGSSISYGDPAKIYPEIHRALAMLLPMASMKGINIPLDILPDIDKSAPFMTPGANIGWSDDKGFYAASITAFPGAAAMTGQQSMGSTVAVVSLGTAILLPSLGRARELSNRTYDAANARGLAQSAIVWSADNGDKLPDHLARLIVTNQITPKQLVNKRGSSTALVMTPELTNLAQTDFDAFSREVDAHCDWVYIGKGMKSDTNSSVIILYEKPTASTIDGMSIAYQDGHAEFTRWPAIRDAFAATNEYLKQNNLPEVDLDALLKNAPAQFRTPRLQPTP